MGYHGTPDGRIVPLTPLSPLYQGYPPDRIPTYLRHACLQYCMCVPGEPAGNDNYVANTCSNATNEIVEEAQVPATDDTASSSNQCPSSQSPSPVTEIDVVPYGPGNVGVDLEDYNAEINPQIFCDGHFYGYPADSDCRLVDADINAQPLVNPNVEGEYLEEGAPPSGDVEPDQVRCLPIRFTNGSCL